MASQAGGASDDAPTTVQECYDDCIEKYPGGGADFIECYNACLAALDLLE
jgi:hypothetical protein